MGEELSFSSFPLPFTLCCVLLFSHTMLCVSTQVRQRIGYCPQVNGLVDLLTGRELLTMFARLRGVPERLIPNAVNSLMADLLLSEHGDKPCGTYRSVYGCSPSLYFHACHEVCTASVWIRSLVYFYACHEVCTVSVWHVVCAGQCMACGVCRSVYDCSHFVYFHA